MGSRSVRQHQDYVRAKNSSSQAYRPMFKGLQKYKPLRTKGQSAQDVMAHLAQSMVATGAPSLNPAISAGYTYLGQFIDHELTLNRSNPSAQPMPRPRRANLRTPRFDLDSIYGDGPVDSPMFFEGRTGSSFRFRIGESGGARKPRLGHREEDLPRVGETYAFVSETALSKRVERCGKFFYIDDDQFVRLHGEPFARVSGATRVLTKSGPVFLFEDQLRWVGSSAIIADSRNDENLIVGQIHLALLKLHNRFFDEARSRGLDEPLSFEQAKRLTQWHFQRVVIDDFLPVVTGHDTELIERLVAGEDCYYKWEGGDDSYMPTEFSVAAFRFGHAMVRPRYFINDLVKGGQNKTIPLFDAHPKNERADLAGGRSLPACWSIQWNLFFGDEQAQPSRSIGRTIDPVLAEMMVRFAGERRPLPEVTLLRGLNWKLPSGQSVAREIGVKPHGENDPLWVYVLEEAERGGGRHLGPVGARIVAEVLVGVIREDENSYLNDDSGWRPALLNSDGKFGFEQLLGLAGMPWDGGDIRSLCSPAGDPGPQP